MAGGTLWVVALGAAQQWPVQLVGLMALPSLLLAVGLLALSTRGATRRSPIGRVGFTFGLLGALALAYGSIGTLVFSGRVVGVAYGPLLFTGVAFGALLLGLGTSVVAVSAIAADVLPRLSPIPLLVGALGVTATGALGLASQLQLGPAHDVFPIERLPLIALWAVFGLGWLWMGYLLYSERAREVFASEDTPWPQAQAADRGQVDGEAAISMS